MVRTAALDCLEGMRIKTNIRTGDGGQTACNVWTADRRLFVHVRLFGHSWCWSVQVKELMANQWIVSIPLEAVKKSDPTTEIFIEAGNVLDGIQVPQTELTSNDPPIEFTCNGEQYKCERLDLETCARPRS
jgi:hypothetical protein